MARILLGYSLDWKTKAVAQAAKCLALSGDRKNAPKPAVSRTLLVKIISRNALQAAFARAVWASWTCLLRVRSECPPLARQLPREKMGRDSVLKSPAVVGAGNGYTAIKLDMGGAHGGRLGDDRKMHLRGIAS